MRDVRVVFITFNNVDVKIFCQNFDENVKFIVKTFDETTMIMKSNEWMNIVKLKYYVKITILWLLSDHSQLRSLILSMYNNHNFFFLN